MQKLTEDLSMRHKQNLNKLRRDFFKTTNKIFRMNLDPTTVTVYCYLCSCNEEFNPSVRYVALKLGLSKTTVSRAFLALESTNVIRLIGNPRRGQTTRWEFVSPQEWIEPVMPVVAAEPEDIGEDDNEF